MEPSQDSAASSEPSPSGSLTPAQSRALFDILFHYQTNAEFQGVPAALCVPEGYAAKISPSNSTASLGHSSINSFDTARTHNNDHDHDHDHPPCPVVRTLHHELIATLPYLSTLPPDFWFGNVLGIVDRWYVTASYDKGALGICQTLRGLGVSVVEGIARGRFGGVPKVNVPARGYDASSAEDLNRAFDEIRQSVVYGSTIDEVMDHMAKTDKLEEHSDALRLVVDYSCIHFAAVMHRIFVLCPDGQLLLKLIENTHNLTPYKMVKHVFRVSNPATIMAAMTKLLLAKMSLSALSNWAGLTSIQDEGLNLLQHIITTVLAWDAAEFRKTAEKIEKAKNGLSPDHLRAVKKYAAQDRAGHARIRLLSMEKSESIVASILADTDPAFRPATLSDDHHRTLLSYLSNLLSARDRTTISDALAYTSPDLFSSTVRDTVAAFDPFLRAAHQGLDIREYIDDAQAVLEDFVACARTRDGRPVPTVLDFVNFARKHRAWLFKWVHRLAVGCPEVMGQYRSWAKEAVKIFRIDDARETLKGHVDELPLLPGLLPLGPSGPEKRNELIAVIDKHAEYLAAVESASLARLQHLLDSDTPSAQRQPTPKKKRFTLVRSLSSSASSSTADLTNSNGNGKDMLGPGTFLARTQALLDESPITPAAVTGPVRRGVEVREGRVGGAGATTVGVESGDGDEAPKQPDVGGVVQALGARFLAVLESMAQG